MGRMIKDGKSPDEGGALVNESREVLCWMSTDPGLGRVH